ncbi:Vacuolar protein sorting-associated protein ist1 [Neocucurbitaria cava]|uniref:Vacuolar protein sorting-associated protein ist1 n=1 Tax=Neocucurbitaria cava TaxID=798079 RepID=A0A9W8YFC9_9PLEO|nr:Vacuolar protein sorting-associated protein ist1 [Neocucurbitaria cava]
MAPQASLVNKLKVQLKLSISRLRMVQQKDSAKAKQQRREMAQLIEVGKVQSARIRVENIIRSDITTELHEILELYCELLLARSQLLEQSPTPSSSTSSTTTSIPLDPALEEAVRSIIYAAPRIEIKELHAVRGFLVEKFGKDVALASMEGEGVAERVVKKLRVETPKVELVDAYLSEIARFYGVPFGPSAKTTGDNDDDEDEEDGDDDDDDEPSDGRKEEADNRQLEDPLKAAASGNKKKDKDSDKTEELAKTNTPKKLGPQSPLRVVPPSPSTDNVAPRIKLPGAGDKAAKGVAKSDAAAAKAAPPPKKEKKKEDGLGKIPDVDELARRFAELKR